MKKVLQYYCLIAFLMISPFISLRAQPNPNTNSGGGNLSGDRIGSGSSGAPIGGGTYILLSLAAIYAARKKYALHSGSTEE